MQKRSRKTKPKGKREQRRWRVGVADRQGLKLRLLLWIWELRGFAASRGSGKLS